MRKFVKYLIFGLLALIGALVLSGSIVYSPTYVDRVLVWQDSDALDWQKFPNHPLSASPTPYHFVSSRDPRVEELFSKLSVADDWNILMETHGTQAFIVIQNGAVLYENYYNDTQRDSIVTSFSVAKSFDSALQMVGIASWYGRKFEGRRTASGEVFRSRKLTLASRVIPLGSRLEITNLENGQRLTARVNDRGPYIPGRRFDVSRGVAQKLLFQRQGLANLRVKVFTPPPDGISGVR